MLVGCSGFAFLVDCFVSLLLLLDFTFLVLCLVDCFGFVFVVVGFDFLGFMIAPALGYPPIPIPRIIK